MSRARGLVATVTAASLLLGAVGVGGALSLKDVLNEAIEHQDVIQKTGEALRKGFSDLTPQEEYYIGRAVAARILAQYRPVSDEARTRYLNTLGLLLARSSSRPETFGGWHFLLIDSEEVNAFAAPGGLVFITTGLFRRCASEEQLAAVVAHEVSHVTLRHGLAAIKSARLTEAFTLIGTTAAKEYSKGDVAKLTAAFEGTIDDIVNKMVVSGYSQGQEYEADAAAARVAWSAGYDPEGLLEFLRTLRDEAKKAPKKGFFSTHPPGGERLSRAEQVIKDRRLSGEPDPARSARFAKFALR